MLVYFSLFLGSSVLVNSKNLVYPCITPNEEQAYCVSLFDCPTLIKTLGSLEPSALNFVKKSICLECRAGDFMVCCKLSDIVSQSTITNSSTSSFVANGFSSDTTNILDMDKLLTTSNIVANSSVIRDEDETKDKTNLLPSRVYCGYQHKDDRFADETVTALDEFPWLVHVKATDIESEYKYGDRCSGVIITKRYVLTDSVCGRPALKVRLGQYNTGVNVSCAYGDTDLPECSEPTMEIRIEAKVFLHEDPELAYSLTLLRLNRTILFTVYPCTTPNNENAFCLPLFNCPGLMKALGSLEPATINYVKNSVCTAGNVGDFLICCGRLDKNWEHSNNATETSTMPMIAPPTVTKPQKTSSKKPPVIGLPVQVSDKHDLLPDRKYCGYQHTDDRFYNESATALDEFPWLVHMKITDLEYESEFGDRCSGVIISSQYVLTDAYCAYHAIKVLVGQHATDRNVSCINDPNLPECTDPTQEIRVESRIQMGKQENGAYDLCLLRLKNRLIYTDYVRPICLPLVESERPTNKPLVFSGWGASGNSSVSKKKLVYDVTTDDACYNSEFGLEGNIKFANVTLLCVTPQKNNTDIGCNGDHGGALMYSYKHQWFADAIVIKVYPESSNQCKSDEPASSIKITQGVIRWILNTIKP